MPEFVWLNKQGVSSSQGFSVQFTGRFSAEYREGMRKLEVEVESGLVGGKPCISYSRSTFLKWSAELPEQQRVIGNFRRALAFQDLLPIEEQ